MTKKEARILYVINGFRQGGAENGLATLLEHGFLEGMDYKIFAFMRGDQALQERLERLAGKERVITFNKEEKLSWKGLLKGAGALWHLLRAYRPTSVILSLKQANIIGRFLLIFFPRIHCIAFEHSAHHGKTFSSCIYIFLLSLLSFRVNGIWADASKTLKETKRFYLWPRKREALIVPLFIAPENPPQKENYALNDTTKLLMVGRLIKDKHHDLVIRTLAARREKGEDISLTIFGTGPEKESLQKLAKSLNIEEHVHFMGHVQNWTQEAISYDILVNPSEREGFCIVVAEAMMVGLPVLAASVGGITDYAENGKNALLVPPLDEMAFDTALSRLIKDEELRKAIGTGAKLSIQKNYAPPILREKIKSLTERLASC